MECKLTSSNTVRILFNGYIFTMQQSLIVTFIIIVSLFFGVEYINKQTEANENSRIFNISDPKECSSYGGIIKTVCIAQEKACVVQYTDAGVLCSSSDDCSGRCVYLGKANKQLGDQVQGTCEAANEPCGCWDLVSDGKIIASGCRD